MDLEKLKPWNWFKHEESEGGRPLPVRKGEVETAGLGTSGTLMQLHREMDRWFDDALRTFGMGPMGRGLAEMPGFGGEASGFFRPQIDVSGDANSYQVSLDVPGMTEDDLSLEVRDDLLVIKGQKEARKEDKDKHYYRVERSYGSFQRTLSLPDDANADEIRANLDKGVLRLEIPRRGEARKDVKRISINA